MTSTWKRDRGGLKISHMSADYLVFKQKIYCLFLQMEGWGEGSQNWSFFVTLINVWPLNGLKLQPIQLLEAVFSSPRSSHKPNTYWLCKEEHPTPAPFTTLSSLHSIDDQTKVCATFNCHLIFCVKRYFGLLNIASWLAIYSFFADFRDSNST